MLELQSAARRAGARLQTGALAQQVLLRGLLLSRAPLDMTSCSKRRCGLNKMRGRLFLDPPGGSAPELLLEFGVLCDECAKTGEGLLPAGSRVCAVLPKRGAQGEREWLALVSAGAARAAGEAEERLGLRRTREDGKFAAGLYSRFPARPGGAAEAQRQARTPPALRQQPGPCTDRAAHGLRRAGARRGRAGAALL